jgi:hypothetical protein
MLRAMREAGDDLRQGKINSLPPASTTALGQQQAARDSSLQQEN